MKLFHGRPERLPVLMIGLTVLCLLVSVGAGFGADPGPLPAQDWNPCNLARIKVPTGRPLTFAVLGDNRSNPAVFNQVLRQLDCAPGLAFAIDVGDLVDRGSVETFAAFLGQVRQSLRLPFLTVLGNHDLEPDHSPGLYRKIFGPDYYSFQVRDNYFIVINDLEPDGVGEAQWGWLEKELRKSRAFKTRLIFLHVPLFDPRGGENHHCLSEAAGHKLAALFRQYRVTHIFAGHIHGYFSGNWDDVPYTISAGAGAPLYGTDPEHFFHHYLKVTLDEGKVHIEVQRLAAGGGS